MVHAKTPPASSLDVSCSYLIGADGAHSIVRKTLGLSFEGAAYPAGVSARRLQDHPGPSIPTT